MSIYLATDLPAHQPDCPSGVLCYNGEGIVMLLGCICVYVYWRRNTRGEAIVVA